VPDDLKREKKPQDQKTKRVGNRNKGKRKVNRVKPGVMQGPKSLVEIGGGNKMNANLLFCKNRGGSGQLTGSPPPEKKKTIIKIERWRTAQGEEGAEQISFR